MEIFPKYNSQQSKPLNIPHGVNLSKIPVSNHPFLYNL